MIVLPPFDDLFDLEDHGGHGDHGDLQVGQHLQDQGGAAVTETPSAAAAAAADAAADADADAVKRGGITITISMQGDLVLDVEKLALFCLLLLLVMKL